MSATLPIVLLEIIVPERMALREISRTHWDLRRPYHAEFVTSDGTYVLDLDTLWVTDLRSGSDAINWFAPKRGNIIYEACVGGHDTAWSGHVSRSLSNEIFIHQGFALSGEVGPRRADAAKFAVDHFGTYYELDTPLPPPYANNRALESLVLQPQPTRRYV